MKKESFIVLFLLLIFSISLAVSSKRELPVTPEVINDSSLLIFQNICSENADVHYINQVVPEEADLKVALKIHNFSRIKPNLDLIQEMLNERFSRQRNDSLGINIGSILFDITFIEYSDTNYYATSMLPTFIDSLEDANYLNLYLVSRSNDPVIGKAEGIGSINAILQTREQWTWFEDGQQYINAELSEVSWINILIHEVGHMLGLLHTHTGDESFSNNSTSGDYICDTPKYNEPIRNNMDDKGEQREKRLDSMEFVILRNNPMSYSQERFMKEFSPQQIRRIRSALTNKRDYLSKVTRTINF